VSTYTSPVSIAQQRLWFLAQLDAGNTAHNVALQVRMAGPLDAGAMRRALLAVVERHESLRTAITTVDGRPVQVVSERVPDPVTVVDLSGRPRQEAEAEADRILAAEAAHTFDLGTAPLVRATLLSLGPEEHRLVLVLHHLVFDGWSMRVLLRELGVLYVAERDGIPAALAALPIQYADYADWQREWLRGPVLEEQLAFWMRQLDGVPTLLRLPLDHPRPPAQTFHGAQRRFEVPEPVVAAVTALARRERCTPFMVLLAAFQALLSRHTGQTDLLVGTPVANRPRAETAGLIGFFVNMLPLRADLSGEPTFRQLLGRVREVALEAFAHQDMPFERLVEELHLERTLSHPPLFQVAFSLERFDADALDVPGLEGAVEEIANGTAKFDLNLVLWRSGQGALAAELIYCTDLFEAATMARLAAHYLRLLEAVVADPDRRPGQVPLLDEEERRRLLVERQGPERAVPGACMHELFERQADRRPDAPAVADGRESLTYRALDERANGLARALRARGVGPEARVGLLLERGVGLVAAELGVLKAGAAYVPLDPANPAERLRWVLEDARAPVLVTDREPAPGAVPEGVAVLLLAEVGGAAERVAGGAVPDNLAYVVYTSGSTGRPKGVECRHRSLASLVTGHAEEFGLTERDRCAQIANPAFDGSAWEVWAPLTTGGSVHVPGEEVRLRPERLVEWYAEHRVTASFLPTGLGEAVLERPWPAATALRVLLVGGDRLHRLARRDLPFAVWNGYGPTECTVFATGAIVDPDEPSPPIGTPVANARAHVLDRELALVPRGVAGELYVAGEGLARGYTGRPDLTAERFLPNPHGRAPGERMYRTGDVVRQRPDGSLEFLGRDDQQVKVRGFRVEPGEIEAVLTGHPGVASAVVVSTPAGLVAYVAGQPDVDELRARLRARLADYMLPQAIVVLDELPLTANGKVDRRALPEPAAESGGEYEAPRTGVEELVARTWAEVLAVEGAEPPLVGVRDNFFELGGHSLLATRAATLLGVRLEIEVPLLWLFENPTLVDLARVISQALRAADQALRAADQALLAAEQPMEAARPAPAEAPRAGRRDEPAPLSFGQQRLWFLHQLDPASAFYTVATPMWLSGALDIPALERALRAVTERHDVLRTVFRAVAGTPVQVVRPMAPFELPVGDLGPLPADEREARVVALATEEAQRPFDLGRGPVLRCRLLRLDEAEHILLLTMHHIVTDAWSLGVLSRELGAQYAAALDGRPDPLPPPPIQYADFARWQRGWMTGPVLEEQLAYWRRQLDGAPALDVPTDRPRPAVQAFHGAAEAADLEPELVGALEALGRSEGCTLFMTLLAAFQALLSRYTGQEDVTVGSPIANRTRPEVADLVGFFVNTLVLRGDLSGQPTFRELLRRVRETALGAYAHQDLPFEKLVEELHPARDLGRNPLFQVMFDYSEAGMLDLDLPGLSMQIVPLEIASAQFDLCLAVRPGDDGARLVLEYNTDLFEAPRARRLLEHYRAMLEAVLRDADRPVARAAILTEAERLELEAHLARATRVRGVRVDLDEVEAALDRHPAVAASAFAVRRDPAGDERLVAYVLPAAGAAAEVRGFLGALLPESRLPSALVVVDSLPWGADGRPDRDRLPVPDRADWDLATAFVAPDTDVERRIAGVWRSLLGAGRMGVYDNFFDLGGHSLLMVEVRRRLREELDVDAPLTELFRHPTIHALARYVTRGRAEPVSLRERQERGRDRGAALDQQRQLRRGRRSREE
jgi:amino acid adenylation domain-containing protein